MKPGEFLNIQPTELKFPFVVKKQSSCSIQLTNKTGHNIAFKVKTTNPRKYSVQPNASVVLPGETCNVTVTMQANKEAPPGMQIKDKFMIQSVVAPRGTTSKNIVQEMFNQSKGKVVCEFILRAVYIPATPPSPTPEGLEKGSSSRPSDNDPKMSSLSKVVARELEKQVARELEKEKQVARDLEEPNETARVVHSGQFLNIHPTELKFPFEAKKQSSCSMQLTNKTDQYIAFKVKNDDVKNCCVRPNPGVILPRSTCNVTVTMQGQKEAPPDIRIMSKFLIQSVVVPHGTTIKELVQEMFNKKVDKDVDEFKFRATYIPANPPFPLPEVPDFFARISLK